MKGLILKDLYYLKTQLKLVILFGIIYGIFFLREDTVQLYTVMISMIMGMTGTGILTIEQKTNWDRYALTMPITKKELVLEKFIIINFITFVTFIITNLISFLLLKGIKHNTFIESIVALSVIMIFLNIILYLIIKYGAEKSRVYLFGVMITIGGTGYIINSIFPSILNTLGSFINSLGIISIEYWEY